MINLVMINKWYSNLNCDNVQGVGLDIAEQGKLSLLSHSVSKHCYHSLVNCCQNKMWVF